MSEVIEKLHKAGIYGCRSCWWQEGGRCYVEPCERIPNPQDFGSVSVKMADKLCEKYESKRSVLATVIPDVMLVIASENNSKL